MTALWDVDHDDTDLDQWHVSELPSDQGLVVRDVHGLTVCTTVCQLMARNIVDDHNRGGAV